MNKQKLKADVGPKVKILGLRHLLLKKIDR